MPSVDRASKRTEDCQKFVTGFDIDAKGYVAEEDIKFEGNIQRLSMDVVKTSIKTESTSALVRILSLFSQCAFLGREQFGKFLSKHFGAL